MKAHIGKCLAGVFAFDEDKNLLSYRLFNTNPEEIAKKLRSNEIIEEEREVLEDLRKSGMKEVVIGKKVVLEGFKVLEGDNLADSILRLEFRKLALDLQFVSNEVELNKLLTQINVFLTKEEMKKPKKDKIIMAVIGVIDETDKVTNTFTERLREWYGLHSPEIVRAITAHDKFSELVEKYGSRENMDDDKLKRVKSSSGMPFEKSDIEAIQKFAGRNKDLYSLREYLINYLESICKKAVPNMTAVGGATLSARLLQLAGGLEKIARMPSSTIQLLGAEKALFRHLKGEGRAPKYGAIYAHQLIQNASKENRGKIARLIAAKLSLAAKIDAYSDRNDGEKLKNELLEHIKKMNK